MLQQFHRLCWPLPQDLIVGLQQHSFEELATLVILDTTTEFGTVAFLCECVCQWKIPLWHHHVFGWLSSIVNKPCRVPELATVNHAVIGSSQQQGLCSGLSSGGKKICHRLIITYQFLTAIVFSWHISNTIVGLGAKIFNPQIKPCQ